MFQDGSLAWDAKDFLIEQEGCQDVTIEQKSYPGKFSDKGKENNAETLKEKKEKKTQSVEKHAKKDKNRKKEKKNKKEAKTKNEKKKKKPFKTEL